MTSLEPEARLRLREGIAELNRPIQDSEVQNMAVASGEQHSSTERGQGGMNTSISWRSGHISVTTCYEAW